MRKEILENVTQWVGGALGKKKKLPRTTKDIKLSRSINVHVLKGHRRKTRFSFVMLRFQPLGSQTFLKYDYYLCITRTIF